MCSGASAGVFICEELNETFIAAIGRELKNVKKVERVKKVIESNSDTFLAKENADLKRRLEISCKFLLKKKEKIEKLQEKIDTLNKKINEMKKAKTFSEKRGVKLAQSLILSASPILDSMALASSSRSQVVVMPASAVS